MAGEANEQPLSYVEDLDPEPERPVRVEQARRREAILGGLLLLALLGVFGWQWWDQMNKENHYDAGMRAAAAGNWTAARDAFSAASGYKDADKLAAEAAGMATNSAVLSGTVALRTSSHSAALFYYGVSGWVPLENSDSQSRVLGSCPGGDLMYDGPWTSPDLAPIPEPGKLPARQVFVATPGGKLRVALGLDARRYDSYLCTKQGVWAILPTDIQPGYGEAHYPSPNLVVTYQDFNAPAPVSPALPASGSWVLTGIAPDREHLLFTDVSGITGSSWHSRLFLGDMQGHLIRELADFDGAPGQWVPDGPPGKILLITYRPVDGTRNFTNQVLLLDPARPGPEGTQLLAGVTVPASSFAEHLRAQVVPVSQGARAGQVVMLWPEEGGWRLRFFSPTSAGSEPHDVAVATNAAALQIESVDQLTGAILLRSSDGTLLYVDRAGKVESLPLPNSGGTLLDAWTQGTNLLYLTVKPQDVGTLYTLSGGQIGTGGVQKAAALCPSLSPAPWPQGALPWHSGTDLLACVYSNGQTHARSYDSSVDSLLDSSIRSFAWPP